MNNENEFILFPSRLKTIGNLFGSLCFVAVSIWQVSVGEIIGWFPLIFFGLCAIVFVISLLPNSSYLRLNPTGFTVCSIFRKHSYSWADVESFAVTRISTKQIVAFNFSEQYKGAESLRRTSTSLTGFEGALPNTFGKSANELVILLNDFKSRYKNS
ncbi:MAG: hypothetical protein JNM55_14670 [Anaerolineales bacterium]|nr:hypothetical protein [Anaerolineales bacterium]